ncbi:MAG: BrnA antitoxin family protein [Rhodoferax sp.]|nr:BrnA antitoxin family protein [Rhodoferax sp.]
MEKRSESATAFSNLPASLVNPSCGGGQNKQQPKNLSKFALDADTAPFGASGDGWQTRINDTLRASLQLAGRLA